MSNTLEISSEYLDVTDTSINKIRMDNIETP